MAYLDRKGFYGIIIVIMVVLLAVLGIAFATLGAADISVADGFRVLLSRVPFLKGLAEDVQLPDFFYTIVLDIRLPRLVLSAMVGAALSVAGTVFQGMLKNPMADPYVVGVSSGAAFGATIALVLNLRFVFAGLSSVSAMAFVCALATILLVYNISRTGTRVPDTTLILSGVAVSAFLSAAVSFIMVISRENLHNIVYWTMGSFTSADWSAVKTVLIPIPAGIAVLMVFAKDLNMMMLGDDTAKSLGVNIELTKKILLVVASVITAA
ncbi:MAG TPA: iron chelate uptake ABC transporter family permease subunit, partial [Clostridiales bacterium]|nr:iron chelate uptake ABC transporter family permease subunit [Clostridiales bacterium]